MLTYEQTGRAAGQAHEAAQTAPAQVTGREV